MTLPITVSRTTRFLFLMCLWLMALPVLAQETSDEESSSGQVIIKGGDNEAISEFRINGQLYMIRITPKKGLPYYLVDADGDGNLETRWNELAPDLLIPSWVLLQW